MSIRIARLHGQRDLRVETLPDPEPAPEPPPEPPPPPKPSEPAPPVPDPVVVPLDELPPTPPPRLRPWASLQIGAQGRARARPGASVALAGGLVRNHLGLVVRTQLVPGLRTESLGPLRWWSELSGTIGVERVGPGVGGGVGIGFVSRPWAEIRGPIGWTHTPLVRGRARWTFPWGRLQHGPALGLTGELGRVDLSVGGESAGRLSAFSLDLGWVVQISPPRG